MINKKQILSIKLINNVYFIYIIFIGILFCKHRALFADCSPALYVFIDKHIPYFGLNRYSTFINYIFPCFLSLFKIPIKYIIYSFGLNYLLLPILVFLFLNYKKTTEKYNVIFLISFTFFNTYTFYYSLHDYWTGFYLFFILIRLIDDDYFKKLKYKNLFVLFFNILILNSHSSMLFPLFVFFIFLYFFYNRENRVYLYYATSIIIIYFALNILFSMSYDKAILTDDMNFLSLLFNLPKSVMYFSFLKTFRISNSLYIFSILYTLIFLLLKRDWISSFLFLTITLMSFLLFLLYFKDFNYNIYTEGQLKAVSTIIPIMIIFLLYKYFCNRHIFIFSIFIYIFSMYNLYNGSFVVINQYDNIKMMLTKFDSNVYLTSNSDACPLECVSISKQSYFINRLEFDKNYCIFSNINNNFFVNNLNQDWINENASQENQLIKIPNNIYYVNADSLGIKIESMFAIYPNISCNEMINRLSNQNKK
jgi:hypothetical protein